jgi:sucrose-phosphate synthase
MDYILISDLDDTLLGDKNSLEEFNNLIISIRENFFLVYSSGRFKNSILSLIKEENLIQPDAIICNVGTEIYYAANWERDKEWENIMSNDWEKNKIIKKLENFPIKLQPYNKEFTASYYVEDDSMVKKIAMALKEFKVKIIFTQNYLLDIIPAPGGKGQAAKFLRSKIGIPTICCGDSENDIDMLKKCDFGILVGNTEVSVKKELKGYQEIYQSNLNYAKGIIEGLIFYKFVNEEIQ